MSKKMKIPFSAVCQAWNYTVANVFNLLLPELTKMLVETGPKVLMSSLSEYQKPTDHSSSINYTSSIRIREHNLKATIQAGKEAVHQCWSRKCIQGSQSKEEPQ